MRVLERHAFIADVAIVDVQVNTYRLTRNIGQLHQGIARDSPQAVRRGQRVERKAGFGCVRLPGTERRKPDHDGYGDAESRTRAWRPADPWNPCACHARGASVRAAGESDDATTSALLPFVSFIR